MRSKTEIFLKRKTTYQKRMQFFSENPLITKTLHMVNMILTYTVFLLYPLLLLWIWSHENELLFRAIVVPLDSFIILTVIRYMINRNRPYEAYGVPAAIHKSTLGKSFPSRHVFCAFLIAVTFICLGPNPVVGWVLLIAGVILGAIRVLLGVHYLSDVLVGAIAGIAAGMIGYSLFY